jgi:hypothetical protein
VRDEQDLTPWFPASVKPVREGVYQRLYDEGPAFCRWDGRYWHIGILVQRRYAHMQATIMNIAAPNQDLPWRGLAKEQANA